jgi:hypothetical protein
MHDAEPATLEALYTEEEFRRDPFHYQLYSKCLAEAVDLHQVASVADVGCANGELLAALATRFPHLQLRGFDYFEWAKTNAPNSVRGMIELVDLRLPLVNQTRADAFDVVNCTEVAEHLKPEHEEQFLANLDTLTRDLLVLSWSPVENPQHFNPKPAAYVVERLAGRGFELLEPETDRLRAALERSVTPFGYQWWGEGVLVFRRRGPLHRKFFLYGVDTAHSGELAALGSEHSGPNFQEALDELKGFILRSAGESRARSIVRASDGDLYFLLARALGSAEPGRRALTVPYAQLDLSPHRSGLLENDLISFGVLEEDTRPWRGYLTGRTFLPSHVRELARSYARDPETLRKALALYRRLRAYDFPPHQVVYTLVYSRWIFRNFPGELGLIGNEYKLDLIRALVEHDEYRDYLGIRGFSDYIPVPQLGAADDLRGLEESVARRLAEGRARVYLVGIGHVKMGLLSRLKRYSNAVFVDVGVGIDAIAGCLCRERPYAARWTNFRLQGYDYDALDQMDYTHPDYDDSKFATVLLDARD